jgi:hypothetical protein
MRQFMTHLTIARRRLTSPNLLSLVMAAGVVIAGPAFASPRVMVDFRPIRQLPEPSLVEGAVTITEFGSIGGQRRGELTLDKDGVAFATDKERDRIPFASIEAFAIEHSTRGLLRGTPDAVAGLAPEGAGLVYKAIRPGAQTLSIRYRDTRGAVHGAVLILPKKARDPVVERSGMPDWKRTLRSRAASWSTRLLPWLFRAVTIFWFQASHPNPRSGSNSRLQRRETFLPPILPRPTRRHLPG